MNLVEEQAPKIAVPAPASPGEICSRAISSQRGTIRPESQTQNPWKFGRNSVEFPRFRAVFEPFLRRSAAERAARTSQGPFPRRLETWPRAHAAGEDLPGTPGQCRGGLPRGSPGLLGRPWSDPGSGCRPASDFRAEIQDLMALGGFYKAFHHLFHRSWAPFQSKIVRYSLRSTASGSEATMLFILITITDDTLFYVTAKLHDVV